MDDLNLSMQSLDMGDTLRLPILNFSVSDVSRNLEEGLAVSDAPILRQTIQKRQKTKAKPRKRTASLKHKKRLRDAALSSNQILDGGSSGHTPGLLELELESITALQRTKVDIFTLQPIAYDERPNTHDGSPSYESTSPALRIEIEDSPSAATVPLHEVHYCVQDAETSKHLVLWTGASVRTTLHAQKVTKRRKTKKELKMKADKIFLGGIAIVHRNGPESKEWTMRGQTIDFSVTPDFAEILAIAQAINYGWLKFDDLIEPGATLLVCSSSKHSLRRILDCNTSKSKEKYARIGSAKHSLIDLIISQARELYRSGVAVTLRYVPSHSRVLESSLANKVARMAADRSSKNPRKN